MAEVEIYTTPICPFCHRAKNLLDKKGVPFTEIDVQGKPDLRSKMTQRAGGRSSVPQVFIDGRSIGGCDDLFDMEFDGELDKLLGAV
ncbi:glutaredoxin 3 [Magnetospira sp. QH-2]|uniref:glutaredoxin 3 n=1 Tax=Magnetospira sp. (strain QH-2) TaxID=1288970 RepID=UPI0003E813CE|nr:glutaredoxin 3 [Magnetospira sp. QH-2]CCQ74781.1 glutaredoxin 3 [Magnetospira sp. QH-2]